MQRDLTSGKITGNLLKFAFPLMIGNLLQQCYNVADTWVVGQFLGSDALAAVGSSYTLHDLFNLDFARALHGERRGFFHAVWEKRLRAFKVLYV